MRIRIFLDDTIPLDIGRLVGDLSRVVPSVTWSIGKSSFASDQDVISNPETYTDLSAAFRKEIAGDHRVFLFTEKPYDNNYFFDSDDDTATIVSLSGWEHLTNLPRANGIVYFTAGLLIRRLGIGRSHRGQNTGCINDFWQDKTGVDSGMRAAFICAACMRTTHRSSPASNRINTEVTALLDACEPCVACAGRHSRLLGTSKSLPERHNLSCFSVPQQQGQACGTQDQ